MRAEERALSPVVITGCSSGLGYELAVHLDKLGFPVVACCRKQTDCDRLKSELSSTAAVLSVDITKSADVAKLAQAVDVAFPTGIYSLVNNAGIYEVGHVEWMPVETFRSIMETNFIGHVAVTKALLPSVRRRQGRIIMISSIAGRFGGTDNAAYCASKFALEGFSDSLRREMIPFGVTVTLIELGVFHSPLLNSLLTNRDRLYAEAPEEIREVYSPDYVSSTREGLVQLQQTGFPTETAVKAVTSAIETRWPSSRRVVGHLAWLLVFGSWLLPDFLSDILNGYLQGGPLTKYLTAVQTVIGK